MKKKIIWFTGLSGAGKSTLSKELLSQLQKKFGIKKKNIISVDGDTFRKKTNIKNLFSKKNIIKNNISIINYIKKLKPDIEYVLVSVISPLKITRKLARKTFGKNYIEVFVYCSLKILKKRDTKGLYLKAKKKKLKNLIGVNSKIKYETTNYSKIKVDTTKLNKKESINKIIKYVMKKNNFN